MKLKVLYTAHLCEETGAIIITPAEGIDVRVQHPISEAHSHVVVDMEQSHSNLIGKWFKCIRSNNQAHFTEGRWYKCVGDPSDAWSFIDNQGDENGWSGKNHEHFDLSGPRDENPDQPKETRIPFDLERWKAGDCALRVETTGGDEVTHLTHFEGMCLIGKVKSNHISSLGFWNELGKCQHFRPNNDLTLIVKQ